MRAGNHYQTTGHGPADDELRAGSPVLRNVWAPKQVGLVSYDGVEGLEFHVPSEAVGRDIEEWGWEKISEPKRMVELFLRIRTPKQALSFARRFGPIYVCSAHSNNELRVLCRYTGKTSLIMDTPCEWRPWERVDMWLACAKQADAALRLVLNLREGRPVTNNRQLLSDLLLTHESGRWHQEAISTLMKNPRLVEQHLRNFLNGGFPLPIWEVQVVVDSHRRAQLDLGIGFLPAVWQVIKQVHAGAGRWALCDACGRLFDEDEKGRVANKDQKSYCLSCGLESDHTDVKNRWRRKRQAEQRTLADFLLVLDQEGLFEPNDLEGIRKAWNEQHPEQQYAATRDLLKELRSIEKSTYRSLKKPELEMFRDRIASRVTGP